MTTPARPSLAETLTSLTLDGPSLAEFWTLALAPSKARGMVKRVVMDERTVRIDKLLDDGKGPRCGGVGPVRWTVDDAAQAFERLTNDSVLREAWTGDPTRAFWCDRCNGHGDGVWRDDVAINCAAGKDKRGCGGKHWPQPRTIADLVAWASLGVLAIERAEELAREAVARLAPWDVARGPRQVVWRVGEPSARGAIGWPYRDVDRTVGVERFVAGHKQTLREGDPHATTAALVRVWPKDAPPCPYAPLLDLLRTGVALDAIADRDLVLVVPPVA